MINVWWSVSCDPLSGCLDPFNAFFVAITVTENINIWCSLLSDIHVIIRVIIYADLDTKIIPR